MRLRHRAATGFWACGGRPRNGTGPFGDEERRARSIGACSARNETVVKGRGCSFEANRRLDPAHQSQGTHPPAAAQTFARWCFSFISFARRLG